MQTIGFITHVLPVVDSTNSYAMQQIQEKLAQHGIVYRAMQQTNGRGTQGKLWLTEPNTNLLLSTTLDMKAFALQHQFIFSAAIALAVKDLVANYCSMPTYIKWPNDIFINDSKAAGILIENKINGKNWLWAVVGIGVNINQTNFPASLTKAISLKKITGKELSVEDVCKKLCHFLQQRFTQLQLQNFAGLLQEYNKHLYKLNSTVTLKKENRIFEATIEKVDENGFLHVNSGVPMQCSFGEIVWLLD